ncbi:MFS transporter [Flavobacterium sp. JP2137]|uniref:MFS transporter n=1 Tax=Flavobacterium sp. JP2137 TaxID=3414510 RepID=UPI003D2FEA25
MTDKHVLLQFPDFRRLFIARLISSIGDKFYTLALIWWLLSTSLENGKWHLALLMVIQVVPVVLFGPLLGTLTDRINKRHAMLVADVIRALLVGLLTYLLVADQLSLPLLYLITFFTAVTGPLFDTAAQASITPLTDVAHTAAAVSLLGTVTQLAVVLGALLGSVLIHWIGIEGAFLCNALSYLLSLCFLLPIKTPLNPSGKREAFEKQFREGFRFLRQNRPILSLLLLFSLLNLFFAPLLLLLPLLVKEILFEDISVLALCEAALAGGAVLMTVYLSFKKAQKKAYIKLFAANLLMGSGFLALGFSGQITPIMLLLMGIGMLLSFTNTLAMTLFQHAVPPEIKGRFFAVLYTVVYACLPVSYLAVGLLSDVISIAQLFWISGMGIAVLGLLFLTIPRLHTQH